MPQLPGSKSPFSFTAPKKTKAPPPPSRGELTRAAHRYAKMPAAAKMAASGGFLAAQDNSKVAKSIMDANLIAGTRRIEQRERAREAAVARVKARAAQAKSRAASRAPIRLAGIPIPMPAQDRAILRGAAEVASNIPGDFPELYHGFKEIGKQVGKAGAHDIPRGQGLIGAASYPWRLYSQIPIALAGNKGDKAKLAHIAATPYTSRGKSSQFNEFSRQMLKSMPASYASLADPQAWKKDPVLQFMNAVSVVAPAARLGSIGMGARAIRAANVIKDAEGVSHYLPRSTALKAGIVRSYRPGMLSNEAGVVGEGGAFAGDIPQRLISVTEKVRDPVTGEVIRDPLTGKPRTMVKRNAEGRPMQAPNPRPTSKSPWGRVGQQKFEQWSSWIGRNNPSSRWAAQTRWGKAEARAAGLKRAAEEAAQQQHVDTLIDGISEPGRKGWGKVQDAFAGVVRTNPGRGALIMQGLQLPGDVPLDEVGNLTVAETGARLTEQAHFQVGKDMIEEANARVDEIDQEIEDINANGEFDGTDPDERAAAIDKLNEERSILRDRAQTTQEQYDFEMYGKVHPVRHSPERAGVLQTLEDQFGKAEAQDKITLFDRMARSLKPDDPAALYREVAVRRAKDAQGLQNPLFQRQLPRKAPLSESNVYRANRKAREAGLPEPHPLPYSMADEVGSTARAAMNAAEGNAAKVTPKHRVYSLTHRLKRIQDKINPDDVDELARWYETLWDWFAYIHGEENAKRAGEAFLASQAAISPEGGVRVVRQVMDYLREHEYAPGTRVPRAIDKATGLPGEHASIHLTADNIAALLLGEHLGTNPAGIAQKLSDFFDSGFGRNVRTMMDNQSKYGGPGVVDRWTMRSDGFIDSDMSRYVEKELGQDPATFQYDDVGSDAVYEYSSQNLNELLKEANKTKLYGRDNWTIDQIQALDWFATRSELGPYVDKGLEDVGGWRGAQQGSMQTVTGEVTARMRKQATAEIVRSAGADIPGDDVDRYVETQGATTAVTFSGSIKNAQDVAQQMADLSGGWAYHISPPGVGTATKRIPILTVTGTPEELRAAQVALQSHGEESVAARAAARAEQRAKLEGKTTKSAEAARARIDKAEREDLSNPLIFPRDDGFDVVFAKEDGTRLGTEKPVEAAIVEAQRVLGGKGTIVRDDRILEGFNGRASRGYRSGDPEGVATAALDRRRAGSSVRFTEQSPQVAAGYAERQAGSNTRAWNLSTPDADDLADGTVVIHGHPDGVGYAITPSTGYLGFLHNNSQIKGAGMDALLEGIIKGGTHGDAYDGFLPATYVNFGWREVARMNFDPRYAPDGWSVDQHGRPDIVFMAYAPSRKVARAKYITDWDEGQNLAREIGAKEFKKTPPEQFLDSQRVLHQRAKPADLTPAERKELAALKQEPPGSMFSDRPAKVAKRIKELEAKQEGVILGATTGMGTGQRVVHLMPEANRTTFPHEMFHAVVERMDERGQRALADAVAQGRPVSKWTDIEHEDAAQLYERWRKNGKLADRGATVGGATPDQVTQPVHDAFSRMEAGGYHNSVFLEQHNINQVRKLAQDIREALDSGDHDKMNAARDALAALSEMSEQELDDILSYYKTPDQMKKIRESNYDRKNLMVDNLRRRGLIGPDQEAMGYAPHFDQGELLTESKSGPTAGGMADTVAGPVKPEGKVLSQRQNKLIRHQLGEILQDPMVVLWQLRQRMRVKMTMQARHWLYHEVGQPITKGQGLPHGLQQSDVIIVRDPQRVPEQIDTLTKAIQRLTPERIEEIRAARAGEGLTGVEDMMDELGVEDLSHRPEEMYYDSRTMPKPKWLTEEDGLRYVPRGVAEARLGKVFTSGPQGKVGAMMGSLNGLARLALIYAPGLGARYVGRNYLQNMVLLAATSPTSFMHLISGANRRLKEDFPEAHDIMLQETGQIQATALPEYNTRVRNRAQRIERGIVKRSHGAGEKLGRYADTPLRSAAYRGNATKWGFVTNEDIDRLLNPKNKGYDASEAGDRMRTQIRQQTRDDMIDFDALSPEEKQVMTRYFFIWPFVRGFTKWPAMYLREYPGRVGAAGIAASSQGALKTEPEGGLRERYMFDIPSGIPLVGGKKGTAQWLSPTGGIEDLGETGAATLTALGRGKITAKPLIASRFAPAGKEALGLLTGEQGVKDLGQKLAKEFIPGAKDVLQGVATATGKQDLGTLALQQAGSQVTTSKGGVRKAGKWKGEVDDAVAAIEKKHGPLDPEAKRRVEKMTKAHGEWSQYEDTVNIRHLDEGKARGLSGQERLDGMMRVARENYPAIMESYDKAAKARGYDDIQALVDSGKDIDGRAKWVADKMYDSMFGSKARITKAGKKAAGG